MPEGPEVKIMVNNIAMLAMGKTLKNAKVINEGFEKKTKGFDKIPDILSQNLRVTEVESKGKLGYILLSNGHAIVITFGMTGNIRIDPTEEYLQKRGETKEQYMKHCKVEFEVEDDDGLRTKFYFHCTRNFAWVYFFTPEELGKKLSMLGPSILDQEPLADNILVSRWRKFNNKPICVTLMEQKLISGIGNYIKAEIMYHSKVYPMALTKDLDDETLLKLYEEARKIAMAAYMKGGASLYTYTGLHGDKSDFKFTLHVYNKSQDLQGNKVERLQTPDKRTTHWVPSVQTIGKPQPKAKIRAVFKTQNPSPNTKS